MQSGLFDYTTDDKFVAEFDADPTMSFTPQQAVDIMKAHDPIFVPGAKTLYTDGDYVLLGLIIEDVTGHTAEDVINNDVVAKLGLRNTVFPAAVTVPDPHPTGYVPDPNNPNVPLRVVDEVNPKVAWTAGGMPSRLEDLNLWRRELSDGSLLTPELQRERLEGHRFEGVPLNVGYGLGVETFNDIVGHKS